MQGNTLIDISSCQALINIGIAGEVKAVSQEFDITSWINAYGANGSVKILHQRACDELPYIPNHVVTEGNKVTWKFDATDSACPGHGLVTLIYTVGTTICDKSASYETYTSPSGIPSEEEPPSAMSGWLQQVLAAADRAEKAAAETAKVIAGGQSGQVLTKLSDDDYDYAWKDLPKYTGEYEISPSFEDQDLGTEGKFLEENMKVKKIGVDYVSNEQAGRTVTIGG